jgi:outer membrane protein OmpA-like peptidoglycan-associated protein
MMRKLSIAAGVAIIMLGTAGAAVQTTDAAPGPFLLFFDWAKPDINRDAATVLDQAVSAYHQRPGARLRIAGHTDRSGSASYNLLASRRRAEEVRAELGRRGVPSSAIILVAYGEGRLLVPTEDGVREVQNRRVEISIISGG